MESKGSGVPKPPTWSVAFLIEEERALVEALEAPDEAARPHQDSIRQASVCKFIAAIREQTETRRPSLRQKRAILEYLCLASLAALLPLP